MKFAAVFTLTTTNLSVEINLRPLESRLIWSRVSSESERFLIYRFCDSSVLSSISRLSFFLRSLRFLV